MKKCFSNIRTLAALLMAGAFAACSSDDNSIEQPANPTAPKTYTLTVNASKGDASTRALALDGTKLLAKWADGDELYVYKATNRAECISDNKLGTISTVASAISADGDQATFTGTLSGTVTVSTGDNLMLVYHPAAFAIAGFEGQAGTLASASNLDCATAQVTASVSGSDITIKETSATFTTHTAMLKLTLTTNGTTTINPTELKMTMTSGTTPLYEFTFKPTDATYNANGKGVLYFALPSVEDVAAGLSTPSNPITTTQLAGVTITYTATVGSDTYVATKTGYTFAAATYYAGTLTMVPTVDLSTISGISYTVTGDVILTGTPTESSFDIKYGGDDYEVTLDNVNSAGSKQVSVVGNRHNINIKLKGTSRLKEIYTGDMNNNTVTIGEAAAGGTLILTGSTDPIRGKTLTINGGTVKSQATGDNWAVYLNNSGGVLTINGGALYLAAGQDGTIAVKGTVSGTLYGWDGSAWVTYTNQRYATTDNTSGDPTAWTW